MSACRARNSTPCDHPGEEQHDVGVSGLALLALLGDGNTPTRGRYAEHVLRGVVWLIQRQNQEGRFEDWRGGPYIYSHACATLALCEAYAFCEHPVLRKAAQSAVDFILQSRNPYSAWSYASPPNGDSDTSVTAWCVMALSAAQRAGLSVDPASFQGAAAFIEEMTDPSNGRTGYNAIGSPSARAPGLNDRYPIDRGEALTAAALLSRVFIGEDVARSAIVDRGADLLRKHPPEWDPSGLYNDFYYWYYGSYALFQLGGPRWDAWNKAVKKTLIESQRRDGDARGSWDARDPWGYAGGRVYATALAALCLEVYFRYAPLVAHPKKK